MDRPALLMSTSTRPWSAIDALDELRARVVVTEVCGVHIRLAADLLHLGAHLLELLRAPCDPDDRRAGRSQMRAHGASDATRRAGDHHHPAAHDATHVGRRGELRIEVALPVVPHLPCVLVQRRAGDAAAGKRGLGIGRVEGRGIVHVGERRVGNAEPRQCLLTHALHRRKRAHRGEPSGQHPSHAPVDAQRKLGRVRRAAERVERVAERQRRRVDDMKDASVEPILVRDMVDCLCDKVDRNQVERPSLGADEGHPLREGVAHLLDELEGVVRPVDAVRLTCLGRTDDHARPVHAPRHRCLGPDDAFGLVLGLVVGMIELLALVEHRLGEGPFEPPCHGDGAHEMEAARTHHIGHVDRVARAGDVGPLCLLGRRREVVDGRQVEELRAADALTILGREREPRLGEVAAQRMQARAARVETLTLCREACPRPWTDEHEDVIPTGEEQRHQVAADEPRRACDEVRHAADNSFL